MVAQNMVGHTQIVIRHNLQAVEGFEGVIGTMLADQHPGFYQGRVIELELPLEGAVGQAAAPLAHGCRLVEDLLKGHRQPSLSP